MTPQDLERYSRQVRFSGIGESGQDAMLSAHVAIVGCGALGSFQAGALARAGVGRLTIIDRDYVELSNLQRQWLFDEADVEQALPKAVAAARHIGEINQACAVNPVVADVTPATIDDLIEGADLLLDGTDNFETRYLLNDFAVSRGIPWVYGGAVGSYGITMPVLPEQSPCFACVYPDPPTGVQPTCETAGVLGSATAAVAALQVASAMRIIVTGDAPRLITTLDVWSGVVRSIPQPERDDNCRVCARHEYSYLDGSRRAPISLCGRNAVQIHERTKPLDLQSLRTGLAGLGEVRANEFALRFFTPPYEMTIFPDGRAIIKGTTDVALARSLYARYIGN